MSTDVIVKVFKDRTAAQQMYDVDSVRPKVTVVCALQMADALLWEVHPPPVAGSREDTVAGAWWYVIKEL